MPSSANTARSSSANKRAAPLQPSANRSTNNLGNQSNMFEHSSKYLTTELNKLSLNAASESTDLSNLSNSICNEIFNNIILCNITDDRVKKYMETMLSPSSKQLVNSNSGSQNNNESSSDVRILESLHVAVSSLDNEELTSCVSDTRSVDQLINSLYDNMPLLLKCLSAIETSSSSSSDGRMKASVLPLVDYLSLYLTENLSTKNNKSLNNATDDSLDHILKLLMEIMLLREAVIKHVCKNINLFKVLLSAFLRASNRGIKLKQTICVVLVFLLVRDSDLSTKSISQQDCNDIIGNFLSAQHDSPLDGDEPSEGQSQCSLNLILSINLGYPYPTENLIMKTLSKIINASKSPGTGLQDNTKTRNGVNSASPNSKSFELTLSSSQLFESVDLLINNIINLFNRNHDPLSVFRSPMANEDTSFGSTVYQDSVLKFLLDFFSSKLLIKSFIYTNDLKVIVDIILKNISDHEPLGGASDMPGNTLDSMQSQYRVDLLSLLDLIVKNCPMIKEQQYKIPLMAQILFPVSEQLQSIEEALIARSILSSIQ